MRRLLPGQYGGGSAYCAPGGGAQYGYAMRPISPCGLNTGSGARLFRSTSSIRPRLRLLCPRGGTIRLRNAPYLALRAQYGLWGAAISLYELNTPRA